MVQPIPTYTGTLRSHSLTLPACIHECSGIRIFGRLIRSLAFTTDVAIIKNINADAIIAVYPFTPQPVIAQATPDIVADIRQDFPEVPIIATGGPTEESIRRTIQAGANAVTYTPPANGVLFAQLMTRYRQTC